MSQEQESSFSKLLAEQKKTFFQFTNQLVNNEFNLYIYYFLISVEHLQILAYQCHQAYHYNNIAVNWFRLLTQLVNPEYYLKHSSLMNYLIPFAFVLVLVHAGLLAFSYYRHREKGLLKEKIPYQKEIILLVTHYFTIIMVTVLTTPIFLTSLLAFYCHPLNPYHPGRKCYDTYHLFIIFMSLINLIWMAAINIYFFLFYFTRNPFAYQNFLSVSSSLWNFLKFVLKVVPPGYLIFDENLQFNILFVFGIAAGLLGYTAISRVIYPYTRYNKHIEKVMIFIEIVFITVSLMFILQAFFTEEEGNNITFIASFVISIPLAKAAFQFSIQREESKILQINNYEKDNSETIESLLTFLIFQMEDTSLKPQNKRFFKVVKLHHDKCDAVHCPCHQYLQKYRDDLKYYEDREVIYKIFLQIIDRCVEENKKAYSMHLLKSYIEYYRLNNGIKGAFIVSKIMREKISFFDDYLINGFLYEVSKSFQDTTNIETYRKFSQHLIKFEKEAMNLAEFYAQFWQELAQQNSSLKKVMNLLEKAKYSKQQVEEEFEILYKIYPTNIRIVDIYKELYKEVLINYDQFMKYNSMYKENCQIKEESKLIRPNHQMKFTANEDLIVLNSSVNVISDIYHGGCEILSVTSNVYKMLGHSSYDLIGKNINRFLPKLYGEFHDQIIDKFLSRDSTEIKTREIIIFPINSNGCLVECAMVNKIMPSLDYGVNIVSFLFNSKLSKENLIIYDQRTGLIDSMSQKAEALLLGKKTKKTSISIPDHISDILPAWDYLKEQPKEYNKKSSRELHLSFKNVYLYRSDGPPDSKHVKVVTFEIVFQNDTSSMKEFTTVEDILWPGFNTLVQNTPHKIQIKENKGGMPSLMIEENKSNLGQSPNMMLPKPSNRQSAIVDDVKLYHALPKCYPKVYLTLEVAFLIGLIGLIVFNYVRCLNYYDELQNDIEIKENVADALDKLLEGSHTASHFVFSRGDDLIFQQVNVDNATAELKDLINIGQYIYQEMIKKQKSHEISISDIMVDVQYFTSPTTILIKSQTVTDATYQLILYLLEIYKNSNPLNNLPNNVEFIFHNCLNISDQFIDLSQILTNDLVNNNQKRKNAIMNMVLGILILFFVSIVWESLYRLIIDSKVNNVIEVYESIPIDELSKYPIKCLNFIKAVCPIESFSSNLQANIKSIQKLDSLQKEQKSKKELLQNEGSMLIEEEEEIEYITFSTTLNLRHILFQSVMFLLIFSSLFILELNSEDSLIQKNLIEVSQWNKITRFRSQLIRTVYLINEHKNRAQQWNQTQLNDIQKMFYDSLGRVEYLLKATTALDSYLSVSYELAEESVFIINNDSVSSEQFLLNEQKILNLSQTVETEQINGIYETNINSTISSFLGMLQLIFIGQIILFVLYAVFYIPKSYRSYQDKNQVTQMMYDTLGYKLQNIAKSNFQNN